jgi:hypothetical protein
LLPLSGQLSCPRQRPASTMPPQWQTWRFNGGNPATKGNPCNCTGHL